MFLSKFSLFLSLHYTNEIIAENYIVEKLQDIQPPKNLSFWGRQQSCFVLDIVPDVLVVLQLGWWQSLHWFSGTVLKDNSV